MDINMNISKARFKYKKQYDHLAIVIGALLEPVTSPVTDS